MKKIKIEQQQPRPAWNQYFIHIARLVSTRSTCLRRHVGAVLTREGRIIATGYNGAPTHLKHCSQTSCQRQALNIPSGTKHELCIGLHAEQNALLQAALQGTSTKDSTLYITNHPCNICAKMLINAGITRVFFSEGYPDKFAEQILREAKIPVQEIPDVY